MPTFHTITKNKALYLPLLLLADPCEAMIRRYLNVGNLHVLRIGLATLCAAVVTRFSDAACELKNIATDGEFQRQGHASHLVDALCRFYAARYETMFVGTAEAGQRFYEQLGFVYSHTVQNFFTEHYPAPVYDKGVLCTDMIYLKRALR